MKIVLTIELDAVETSQLELMNRLLQEIEVEQPPVYVSSPPEFEWLSVPCPKPLESPSLLETYLEALAGF